MREDALMRVAREAPDFWAWRSGVFEFVPEPDLTERTYEAPWESGCSPA
jgi:hypothetical protein